MQCPHDVAYRQLCKFCKCDLLFQTHNGYSPCHRIMEVLEVENIHLCMFLLTTFMEQLWGRPRGPVLPTRRQRRTVRRGFKVEVLMAEKGEREWKALKETYYMWDSNKWQCEYIHIGDMVGNTETLRPFGTKVSSKGDWDSIWKELSGQWQSL